MPRLIDADALLEYARNHVGHTIDCNDIARFPTIDAEPVRHARWEETDLEEFLGFRTQWVKCSECGKNLASESITVAHGAYCPWCGAKMDLNEEKREAYQKAVMEISRKQEEEK